MTEFRIFCIVYALTSGLICAAINHGLIADLPGGPAGIVMVSSSIAAAFIAFFLGRRAA